MASPRTRRHERIDPERNRAWAEWLVRERHRWLRGVAYRARAADDAIEDVVQSALLDFLRAFPGPDEEALVLGYVGRCVESQARKGRRRHARKESRLEPLPEIERNDLVGTSEPVGVEDTEAPDPLEMALSAEELERLAEIVRALPEDQRAVVLLAAAGYGTAEIAKLRGLSERQVRKRAEKAHRRLRGERP